MAELTAGDAKLVQYLNEAYGTEKRLETSLEAHIAMTAKASYRKRLREHLTETKRTPARCSGGSSSWVAPPRRSPYRGPTGSRRPPRPCSAARRRRWRSPRDRCTRCGERARTRSS